jgi:hypothetical protein
MTAQQYISSQLESLNSPVQVGSKPETESDMVDAVLKSLMSKKFRKFSIPEKNKAIIREAVGKNIKHNEPIKITWPFGGYKLWSLAETPEPDWAELFTMIYLAQWLKPVCAIYQPGAVLTFWEDEVVISKMNNIPQSDLDEYHKSFTNLINFISSYLPKNLVFDDFQEREQYESTEAFEAELKVEMEKLKQARAKNPQPLSDAKIRSIEMNVRVTPEQAKDPLWREKVDLMHYAYYNLQESKSTVRKSYPTDNIVAFTVFFEPNVIPVGTTKTSIAKFWVGIGALQRREDSFIETILSPSQIEKAMFTWEKINIPELLGKNFKQIRILT